MNFKVRIIGCLKVESSVKYIVQSVVCSSVWLIWLSVKSLSLCNMCQRGIISLFFSAICPLNALFELLPVRQHSGYWTDNRALKNYHTPSFITVFYWDFIWAKTAVHIFEVEEKSCMCFKTFYKYMSENCRVHWYLDSHESKIVSTTFVENIAGRNFGHCHLGTDSSCLFFF